MKSIISLTSGAIFGLGLLLSGMTDTQKVQGFLDITGAWDPTLIFVMGGAIIPMLVAWRVIARRDKSFLGLTLPERANRNIDNRLALGSVLFGAGWGLSGFCPGPAIASLSFGGTGGWTFFIAMAVGMYGYGLFRNRALA